MAEVVTIMNPLQAAHTTLLARLTVEKPNRIAYCADRRDLEERAAHIEKTLGAVLEYVGAVVTDTALVAPGGTLSQSDQKYILNLIVDVASDVANAADRLGSWPERLFKPAAANCCVNLRSKVSHWEVRSSSSSSDADWSPLPPWPV
jgi:hypothetical protein